jgi:hypothetical protein
MDDVASVAPVVLRRSDSDGVGGGGGGRVSPVQSPSARSTPAPRHPHSLASLPAGVEQEVEQEPEPLDPNMSIQVAAVMAEEECKEAAEARSAPVSGQKRPRREYVHTYATAQLVA